MLRHPVALGAGTIALAIGPIWAGADAPKGGEVSVPVLEHNDSHLSGNALLTPLGAETRIALTLHDRERVTRPAHIADHTCVRSGAAARWHLANVVNGWSETVVPAPIEAVLRGDRSINIGKSIEDARTVVACGTLR